MSKIKKQEVQQLFFTKWILLQLKLIFTSSVLCLSCLCFSQSDTTFSKTIRHENSSAPDTVIIERIKVQKERVFLVKRDTIIKTDTVIQIKKETVIKNDTVVIYKKRKPHVVIGLSTGVSFDYDHTHYWSTHSDFYTTQKVKTKEKLNWNTELFLTFKKNRWQLHLNSGVMSFRDQLETLNTVNKLTYFAFSALPSYRLSEKKWGHLSLGLGTGFKSLLLQKGTYINPDEISITSVENRFFPTNKNLWFLTARLEAEIKMTERFSVYPQLRYETHPTSITTVEHPILFWRDLIGLNISMGWEI